MEMLSAFEVVRLLNDHPDALLIDCRSEMEFRFVGHPTGALHVAWNDGAGWDVNPGFVDAVTRLAGARRDRRIALICRSGDRAVHAAQALELVGYPFVYVVRHGFEGDIGSDYTRGKVNGWRCDGLPWEMSPCTRCAS
jgi:rhodanese-related sulfurtransferase